MTNSKAHVIVVSNEKGGTGKSTISMHLAIKLMQEGFRVAVVDTDGRQGTLTHYIENRRRFCRENDLKLPIPELLTIEPAETPEQFTAHREQAAHEIGALLPAFDAVIIDTPGNKNYLFEEAHKFADTLITPMSDSLIDLNVISEIDFAHPDDRHAGRYAQYIWEVKNIWPRSANRCSTGSSSATKYLHSIPATKTRFSAIWKKQPKPTASAWRRRSATASSTRNCFAGADGAGSQSRSLKMPLKRFPYRCQAGNQKPGRIHLPLIRTGLK